MAQVPYNPVPTATPSSPGERVSVNTPGEAFGTNIGAALRQVGTSWEQVGDAVFNQAIQYQRFQNETDARRAASDYAEQQAKLQADFDALPQDAAVKAYPGHLAQARELRDKYRGNLASPEAQRMYDGFSFGFMERNIFSSARHAGDEQRKAIDAGFVATQRSTLNAIPSAAASDKDSDGLMQSYLVATAKRSAFEHGLDTENPSILNLDPHDPDFKNLDPRVAAAVTSERSKVVAERVRAVAALHSDAAEAMANRYKKELGPVYEPLIDYIQQRGMAVATSNIADDWAKRPDLTIEQRAEGAADQARRDHPDNEHLPQAAKQAVKNRVFLDDAITQRDQKNTQHSLTAFLGQHPEITDAQALFASPEGNAIASKYGAVGLPHTINDFENAIAKTQATNYSKAWEVRYQSIRQMATSGDPEVRSAFINLDPNSLDIGPKHIADVAKLQHDQMKEPKMDPRVNTAFSILVKAYGGTFSDMGIDPRQRNDYTSNYNTFQGVLQESLETWIHDHNGKQPTEEDIKGPIWRELTAKYPGPDHFWNFFSKHGFKYGDYHQTAIADIPAEAVAAAQKDAREQGRAPYSPEEIQRLYNRIQYSQFFGHSASKPDKGKPSGGPPSPGPE